MKSCGLVHLYYLVEDYSRSLGAGGGGASPEAINQVCASLVKECVISFKYISKILTYCVTLLGDSQHGGTGGIFHSADLRPARLSGAPRPLHQDTGYQVSGPLPHQLVTDRSSVEHLALFTRILDAK